MEECVFCKIAQKEEPANFIWQDDDWMAIENLSPKAPVHVLVMPKEHIKKKKVLFARPEKVGSFWGNFMWAVGKTVQELGLDETGYRLVNNGAGYNHFEHEHIHVMGKDPDLARI